MFSASQRLSSHSFAKRFSITGSFRDKNKFPWSSGANSALIMILLFYHKLLFRFHMMLL
jgi:hypothetical protein